MRRALLVVSAVLTAVTFSAFSAVLAQAQAADQYKNADGSTSEDESAAPTKPGGDGEVVSQGSLGGDALSPEASSRIEKDIAEEERLPDYFQVVDNSTKKRFSAPGSRTRSDASAYDGEYVQSGARGATFRVKAPTTSDYALYAWWPKSGAAEKARFTVPVAGSGNKVLEIDQTRDGGDWVKVGVVQLAAGERKIRLASRGKGPAAVAADAIVVVRGEMSAPPGSSYPDEATAISARRINTAKERRSVVRSARRWMGTPYRYATCKSSRMSCTCLTKRAWSPNGHRLPLTERGQWRYEPSKRIKKSNLKRGDVVFFKEGGSRYITHVAIYSGNGYVIHASNYRPWQKVVESEMRYITGYHGANRMYVR